MSLETVSFLVGLAGRHAAAGAFDEARAAARRAVSAYPDDTEVWSFFGLIAGHQRDAAWTYVAYCRRLSLAAAGAPERLRLALAAVWVGQPEVAGREFGAALTADPSLAEAGEEVANAALTSGMIDLAEALFETLIARRPDQASFARGLHMTRALGAGSTRTRTTAMHRWGTSARASHHPVDMAAMELGSPRYLIIRGYGVGFWGEVAHVASHLALADILGRVPVVHWGPEVRYRDGMSDTNAWISYFEATAATSVSDLKQGSGPIFLDRGSVGRWRIQRIDRCGR